MEFARAWECLIEGRIVRAPIGLQTEMARIDLSPSHVADRARQAARGSLPPAGADAEAPITGADGRRRRAIRQRLRRTRSLRRARVSELGLLVADMQGRGRWNQRLVDERAREIDSDDREIDALGKALLGDGALDGQVAAECPECGRIGGAGEQFCTGCGARWARDLTTIQPSA